MRTRRLHLMSFGALALVVALGAYAANAPAPAAKNGASAAAADRQKASVPLALSPRFNQVRSRIDALFAHRNQPPPASHPRMNPFRPPGAIVAPPPDATESPKSTASVLEPASDLVLLQEAVATMRVSGSFEFSGKSHPVINGRPYKEGDVISTLVRGETIYVRVRSIMGRTVRLALNEAEMNLSFDSRPSSKAGSLERKK